MIIQIFSPCKAQSFIHSQHPVYIHFLISSSINTYLYIQTYKTTHWYCTILLRFFLLSITGCTVFAVVWCSFDDWPVISCLRLCTLWAHRQGILFLLRLPLLIESQPCSLWLACVLAFKSLLIPTALSARIKYPLILHRRPFNWAFSHLACLSEHQRHQGWHDLSKLVWTSFSLLSETSFALRHRIVSSIPPDTFFLSLFIDILLFFASTILHSSSLKKLFSPVIVLSWRPQDEPLTVA